MKIIDKVIEFTISIIYGALVAFTVASVFCRYVLNDSIVWSEELTRYLFVWIVFLGVPFGIERGAHVSVDFLTQRVSPSLRRRLIVFHNTLVCVFVIILFIPSLNVVRVGMGSNSLSMEIPMGFVYLAFPVGWLLIALYLVRNTLRELRGGGLKEEV